MNYQSLTQTQHAQVAYLFADDVFGTDATAFDYEVKDNNVIGRSRIGARGDAAVRKAHTVRVNVAVREIPAELITVEMDRNTLYTIQSIARSIVERIIQSQSVEA